MAKNFATVIGAAFVIVGLFGFYAPNVFGMHLSIAHDVIHLVSGVVALYFGLFASREAARLFDFLFGAVYLGLGLVGWFWGMQDATGLPDYVAYGYNHHMFTIIPGVLEFGAMDHLVHVLIGGAFLIGGSLSRAHVKPLIEGPTN